MTGNSICQVKCCKTLKQIAPAGKVEPIVVRLDRHDELTKCFVDPAFCAKLDGPETYGQSFGELIRKEIYEKDKNSLRIHIPEDRFSNCLAVEITNEKMAKALARIFYRVSVYANKKYQEGLERGSDLLRQFAAGEITLDYLNEQTTGQRERNRR